MIRPTLDEIEIRVLGVLIEKSLTQAGTYPMTMNAIVLGANQKQNRDPVMEIGEGDVAKALTRLQQKRLVKQAPPSAGARSNRFAHACVDAFQWDRRQQAIMCELFLRGRQTPGELRTHASRMTPFPDLEAIGNTLNELSNGSPPFVEELLREPGRAANRWRHVLGTDEATPAAGVALRAAEPSTARSGASSETAMAGPRPVDAANDSERPVSLEDRVNHLETQVTKLVDAVSQLRSRMDALTSEAEPKTVQ